ncbi:MAG: serine dehydratase subunit alpha family protein [Spirochaetales bacterium]|nr:serine dehydratase subunit alpha family protein [Spirochaetales bacterium]
MNKELWNDFISLIKQEVVPALGCTEPIAVALAAAKAAETLSEAPERIEVYLSQNVLKNGMSVGIPGTGLYGLEIATAVGALSGKSEFGLEVLKDLSAENLQKAKDLLASDKIKVFHKEIDEVLYIEVVVMAGENSARVIIKGRHDNICLVEHNGIILLDKDEAEAGEVVVNPLDKVLAEISEKEIWEFAMNAPLEDLDFIMEAVELNKKISDEGLIGDYGLRVGKSIDENILKGFLQSDLSNDAVKRTASGADARMAGSNLPVMSNSGSGNQGITATMPVVAVAEKLNSSNEQLIRALILSHLTSIHMKSKMNRLSPLCGASVAATGASCGVVFLLGGVYEHVEYAIKNMVGNIAGMVCDGAKNSCALKVASCVSAGVQGALLAINSIRVSEIEGLVEEDIERTINNLGILGSSGMADTDRVILSIMTSKENNKEKKVI